jgi:hypothetical protein
MKMKLSFLALFSIIVAAAPVVSAQDNPQDYRAVLIPLVSHQLRGAHGSLWDSELHVFNASFVSLRMLGATEPTPVLPIDPAVYVDGLQTRRVDLYSRDDADGALLYVPNTHVGAAKMSLRVRDISENATSLGDEVPVVRADHGAHELSLVDVPIDPKYRATLRIYSFAQEPLPVRVTIYPEDGNVPLQELDVMLQGVVNAVFEPFPPYPAYLALDPLPAAVRAAGGDRVRIEITNFGPVITPPPPRIWAFVSLTNNETNQVTIVTPK